MRLWTIGHSTRSLDELVTLLQRQQVTHIADVRRFPASRRYPHFSREVLAADLTTRGIGYSHHPLLGGRRKPLPNSPHGGWRSAAFRGYADHMDTPEFRFALAELVLTAAGSATAILCAEAVPWRCHRSLIADALVAGGAVVEHILESGTSAHALTRFAVVRDGRITYPPQSARESPQWNLFAK